jgi:hypothetical protein
MKRPPIVPNIESRSTTATNDGRQSTTHDAHAAVPPRQRRIVRLVVGRRLAIELAYQEPRQPAG